MKTSILTLTATVATVATLALAAPAIAADNSNVMDDVRGSVSRTGDKIAEETNRVKTDVRNSYNEARAEMRADKAQKVDPRNNLYSQLEGTNIHNANGDKVAEIEDVLVDQNGKVSLAVLSANGEYKTVDYNALASATIKNEPRLTVPAATMDSAKQIEYKEDDAASLSKLIPAAGGAFSLESLDGANIIDAAGNKLGEATDFHINNGNVADIKFKYDTTLGMGGKEGTLAFRDTKITRDGDDFRFQVSNEIATRIKSASKN